MEKILDFILETKLGKFIFMIMFGLICSIPITLTHPPKQFFASFACGYILLSIFYSFVPNEDN